MWGCVNNRMCVCVMAPSDYTKDLNSTKDLNNLPQNAVASLQNAWFPWDCGALLTHIVTRSLWRHPFTVWSQEAWAAFAIRCPYSKSLTLCRKQVWLQIWDPTAIFDLLNIHQSVVRSSTTYWTLPRTSDGHHELPWAPTCYACLEAARNKRSRSATNLGRCANSLPSPWHRAANFISVL